MWREGSKLEEKVEREEDPEGAGLPNSEWIVGGGDCGFTGRCFFILMVMK